MNLKEFEAQGLKKYEVGLVVQRVEIRRIWAKSPQEAAHLVAKENFGSHAGQTPPQIVEVLVKELNDAEPADHPPLIVTR